ncbi:unnamed protein product [Paramecium octaurelia]|uniref:Tetratricopeptide repeat protein n=1 Tax=Paramecium octaurelia TaxID=43137 RepID=A0A8S1YK57_PAROT|nr:unnamed protein product [Paramecium octaurelia]
MLLKGACLRMLNKYEYAIIWLDKVLVTDPKNVFSLSDKGECLRLMKQYDKSEKDLQLALSINPNHTFSLDMLVNCLYQMSQNYYILQNQQKYFRALIYYERKLKFNPNDQWIKIKRNFVSRNRNNESQIIQQKNQNYIIIKGFSIKIFFYKL